MLSSINVYSRLKVSELDLLVESFKVSFDLQLQDLFSDEELNLMESKIDSMAAIYVQPILNELTFDDFYCDSIHEEGQRQLFSECRSTIIFENIPYLETNPFQVTYLIELLEKMDDVIIDCGGVSNLLYKENFLKDIRRYKGIDTLLSRIEIKSTLKKTSAPVDPIDFLIQDVYKEFDRLKNKNLDQNELSEKVQKIFLIMRNEKLDSEELFRKTGLGAKDFDDGLERLKFWLRKF